VKLSENGYVTRAIYSKEVLLIKDSIIKIDKRGGLGGIKMGRVASHHKLDRKFIVGWYVKFVRA
jgi:hypothetical protein